MTAGTCTLTAFVGTNPNYVAAPQVSQSFTVTPGTQAITFNALPNVPLASSLAGASATSSAGLVVAFTSLTPAICTTSGPTGTFLTVIAVGTCTIQAQQAGNANWLAATPVNQSFQVLPITNMGTPGLRFVPVAPCRVLDTRNAAGPFGGPALAANTSRDFVLSASACGIPANASAYSVNVTVVPLGPLGYITTWPTGLARPTVSTLNSVDGRVKANAAIVASGANGAISIYASDATHLILDVNGYFVPANGNNNLAFYPVTPCRLADTRGPAGTFGAPSLAAGPTPRNFPITQGSCGIPSTAQAYSLNVTAIPKAGSLAFLTAWPTGGSQPVVSTLNAPTGVITANAAIIPAGTNGSISMVVTNPADVVIDVNGYFAPPGNPGALNFYTMSPCRLADTRIPNSNQYGPSDNSGYFNAPPMVANTTRAFPVPYDSCPIPITAQAYSVNATVVPQPQGTIGGLVTKLGFLTVWGPGSQPLVSNLNSPDGSIVSNAAIVQAGFPNGQLQAFVTDPTHLIIDVTGYFAQ